MPAGLSVDKEVCLIKLHSFPKTWVSENCLRIFLWLCGVGDEKRIITLM